MAPLSGWNRLLAGWPWFHGQGNYPIPAYSEFLPPPRLGRKPYSLVDWPPRPKEDPHGWPVTEYEEALELRPGLANIARQVIGALARLGQGKPHTASPATNSRMQPLLDLQAAALAEHAGAAGPRTLCDAGPTGPIAHAGRQGPRTLDVIWR